MTELSHAARAVVNVGKGLFEPTQADRVRVTELLTQRMDAIALGAGHPPHAASSALSRHAFKPWVKALGTFGLVAIGGALYLAYGGARALPPPANAVASRPAAVVAPSHATDSLAAPSEPPRLPSARPIPAESIPRASRARVDTLGEEVAILTMAGKELHNGRPASALKALDEHQRRFPAGALAQERSAARIQALCALGQTSQAEVESAKLARVSPRIARAEHPCEPQ